MRSMFDKYASLLAAPAPMHPLVSQSTLGAWMGRGPVREVSEGARRRDANKWGADGSSHVAKGDDGGVAVA